VTPEEQALPDKELRTLVNIMSEVLAVQALCKTLKKEGYDFDGLDTYLVGMHDISQALVARMNRRLMEINGDN
jgi:hypothetical protein